MKNSVVIHFVVTLAPKQMAVVRIRIMNNDINHH